MTKTKRKAFNAFKNNSIPNPQKLEIKTKTNEEVETFILTVELETSKELLDHFKEQMKADEFIQQRITDIKNGVKFGSHDFYIKNGLLIRRSHIRGSPTAVTQIVVLREARQMFLEHFHNSIFACHYSKDKTVDLILCKYWWPQIYDDVSYWCSRCIECQKRILTVKNLKSPLKPIIPASLWDIVAVDVCLFNA